MPRKRKRSDQRFDRVINLYSVMKSHWTYMKKLRLACYTESRVALQDDSIRAAKNIAKEILCFKGIQTCPRHVLDIDNVRTLLAKVNKIDLYARCIQNEFIQTNDEERAAMLYRLVIDHVSISDVDTMCHGIYSKNDGRLLFDRFGPPVELTIDGFDRSFDGLYTQTTAEAQKAQKEIYVGFLAALKAAGFEKVQIKDEDYVLAIDKMIEDMS